MSTAFNAGRILRSTGVDDKKMFDGIYLASVVSTNDPEGKGRVTLKVPQILGTATSYWAVPLGFTPFSLPAPGTMVHAYFAGGDINRPVYIYTGGIQQSINNVQQSVNNLTPGAWSALTPLNGWTNITGYLPVRARILQPTLAQVAGTLQSGVVSQGEAICVLPSGMYNTTYSQIIGLSSVNGGQGSTVASLIDNEVSTGTPPVVIVPNVAVDMNTPAIDISTSGVMTIINVDPNVIEISFNSMIILD